MQSGATDHFSLDTDEARFKQDVLEESQRRPVVVDFWAPWCGPCRTLGPTLEKLAQEGAGRWLLAKVNVDENQRLATLFRVQSIPAVKAFHQGQLVDQFNGALPEVELRRWLEGFVPGPAEEAVAEGRAHEAAGRLQEARAAFERALASKARQGDALLGLARLEIGAGELEAGRRHLDQILPPDDERLGQEIAALRVKLQAAGVGGLEEAAARAAAAPEDPEAQLALGKALAAAGQHEAALEALLGVVKRLGRAGAGDEARQAMLEIFGVVGQRSELADRYRRQLAAELYK